MDFARVAGETLALVTAQRRYGHLQVESVLPEDLPQVLADPSAVTQILLNLLLNAADAIAAQGGGGGRVRLLLRAAALGRREGDLDDEGVRRRRPDAVECLVCDDGCGIPEADRERIFDPFYTTKDPGEGTGLGLANSARVAEQLGGVVEWMPAPPGFRTAIALRLPALPAEAHAASGRARGGAAP
jgi:signal transduction histidine kinase